MKVSISIVILCLSLANTANLFADNQCISYPDQFVVDCDAASPLEWDSDRSIQEIDNNSSGHIAVKGERAQYSWTLSGQGFSFDQSGQAKSISTTTPLTTLYTQDACGTATITVDDGCSVITHSIRATTGRWVRLGDPFHVLNVYKPDEHGMFPFNVNGYGYSVPGRLYSADGQYCMSVSNPNTTASESWYYRTWVVYTAPDGRYGHWADCRSHVGETVKDPIVGAIDIPVYGRTDVIPNYGGCLNFHRHYALTSSSGFSIWKWECN